MMKRSQTLVLSALVSVVSACGGGVEDGGPSDEPTSGGGGGGGGAGVTSGGTGTGGSWSMPTCESTVPNLGSCISGYACIQGINEFYASASLALCIPELGSTPSTEPCTSLNSVGRCFEPSLGAWVFYSDNAAVDVTELETQCLDENGVWCGSPSLVPVPVAQGCTEACDAARPDYTGMPECEMVDSCVDSCIALVVARGDECVACVTEGMVWEPGHCSDWECVCPPPTFSTSEA